MILSTFACSGLHRAGGGKEPAVAGPEEAGGAPLGVFVASRTPARTVPPDRWDFLRPVQLSNKCSTCPIEDSTGVQGEPGDTPFFHELDIVGNYLFTATGQGMLIYNITDPQRPTRFRYVDASNLLGPPDSKGCWGFSDKNFFISSISVPKGNSNVAVTGAEDFGVIAWDTSTKNEVTAHYQDCSIFARAVYAAGIGNRDFAFVVGGKNLRLYDLTAAAGYSYCNEPAESCPGVFKGTVASGSSTNAYVTGVGKYVFYRNQVSLKIFDMSTAASFPATSPAVKLQAPLTGVTAVGEATMWKQGSKFYLAFPVGNASHQGELRVYDVSCIATSGGCAGLPSPWTYPTPDASVGVVPLTIDASSDGSGKPYLYVGTTTISRAANPVCVPQREYFFDASDPADLVELTPKVHPDGYWGWYYEPCFGYNSVAPRHAKMKGNVLYRAAYSILDSHQVSTDPEPRVTAVEADVDEAFVCSQVTFTAIGASGQPPLSLEWRIDADTLIFNDGFESGTTTAWSQTTPAPPSLAPAGPLALAAHTFVWSVPADARPGDYTATVRVSNSVDPVGETATSDPVLVRAFPPLTLAAPTADLTATPTVAFQVASTGATQWRWNFGDGTNSGWISDPALGSRISHTYAAGGTYNVTAKVRNCLEGPLLRQVQIVVPEPDPLVLQTFRAQCEAANFCFFHTGETVHFTVSTSGSPERYEYDWTSPDGVFRNVEQVNVVAPVTSHTYTQAGSYKPVMRIKKGGQSVQKADQNSAKLNVQNP